MHQTIYGSHRHHLPATRKPVQMEMGHGLHWISSPCFVEIKFQGFLLYPEEARQWEIKIGHSYEYFLLVKCWYLQHFCSVVTELKGLLLAQAQGRIGFFINPGVQPNVVSEKGSPDTAWGTKVQPLGLHLLW